MYCLYLCAGQSFDGSQSIQESLQGDAGSGSESEDEFGYTKSEWPVLCSGKNLQVVVKGLATS